METEILRIIEGGLSGDKRKIISYSNKLAERLEREGKDALAKCIRQKISSNIPQDQIVADAVRLMPVDMDSHLHIVEVYPPDTSRQPIVLPHNVVTRITDFIDMVNHRMDLEVAGINIQKTMLLHGQPGCGKTSIAHYIAEKTGLPLVVARLDTLVSSLLGNTAKNIRKIFDYVRSIPCILFLDEFDAIAKARDDVHELGELKRVINSLLQNIDTMSTESVLIAATNHPQMLDSAIWRRFVQVIEVGLPSEQEICEMFEVFSKPFRPDFIKDTQRKKMIIDSVVGLSPSDIKTIFDKTKVKCVLKGNKAIELEELLFNIFDFTSKEKSELSLVRFLASHSLSQNDIYKRTGISLRKIKSYLAQNYN